jgi:hypothetical protein
MTPDYNMRLDEQEFKRNFGFEYSGEGWYNNGADWMLAVKGEFDIIIKVWGSRDPRPEILSLVGLPNRVEGAIIPV